MKPLRRSLVLVLALGALGLTGCASYYQTHHHAGGGVYYETSRYHAPAYRTHVRAVSPVYYPYWSLDYFYFSRYYHPYSVLVHHYDPWFYPYPGWYYGYRPGPRVGFAVHYGHYYPWYAFSGHYRHHRPWLNTAHVSHHGYSQRSPELQSTAHRTRINNERLQQMQRREALAARSDRRIGGHSSPVWPATRPHRAPGQQTGHSARNSSSRTILHQRRDLPTRGTGQVHGTDRLPREHRESSASWIAPDRAIRSDIPDSSRPMISTPRSRQKAARGRPDSQPRRSPPPRSRSESGGSNRSSSRPSSRPSSTTRSRGTTNRSSRSRVRDRDRDHQ